MAYEAIVFPSRVAQEWSIRIRIPPVAEKPLVGLHTPCDVAGHHASACQAQARHGMKWRERVGAAMIQNALEFLRRPGTGTRCQVRARAQIHRKERRDEAELVRSHDVELLDGPRGVVVPELDDTVYFRSRWGASPGSPADGIFELPFDPLRGVAAVPPRQLFRKAFAGGAPVPFAVDVSSGRTTERKCGHDAIRSRSALTGHGVWSFSGANTYAARFVAMILFDTPPAPPAPGFQTGWLLVRSSFTLVDATRRDITATAQIRAVHPI